MSAEPQQKPVPPHYDPRTVAFRLPREIVTAHTILQDAANNIIQRAEKRDMLDGERSMARTVAAFNALTGSHLTEVDGCMFMVLLKAAHATSGKHHADDYTDGSSYFALAGEAAHDAAQQVPAA